MGARGPQPGAIYKPTRDKAAAREALRRIVDQHMEELVEAQLHNAKGIKHFFLRDKSGKFVMIDDPKQIEVALNSGEEGSYYWIFTKDPSVQAFTDLMNRALDKPKEPEQEIKLTGEVTLIEKLFAGRKRAAERG